MSKTEALRKGDRVRLIDVSGFVEPDRFRNREWTVTRGGTGAIYLRADDGAYPDTFATMPKRLLKLEQVAEPETKA